MGEIKSGASVKEYILDNETKEDMGTKPTSVRKNHEDSAYNYIIEAEDETDFVIRKARKTGRGAQWLFVFLLSCNQYYIQNCKTGENAPLTIEGVKEFYKDLKKETIKFKKLSWMSEAGRETFCDKYEKLAALSVNDASRELILSGYIQSRWFAPHEIKRLSDIYKQNKEAFKRYVDAVPGDIISIKDEMVGNILMSYERFGMYDVENAIDFCNKFGTEYIEEFVRELNMSNVRVPSSFFKGMNIILNEKKIELDPEKYLQFVFLESYKQGFENTMSFFYSQYKDYIDAGTEDGILYPKDLSSANDRIRVKRDMVKYE